MVKTTSEFVMLVLAMRNAQKEYFSYKTTENLNVAKALEKEVDEAVKQWMKRQEEKIQPQLNMEE